MRHSITRATMLALTLFTLCSMAQPTITVGVNNDAFINVSSSGTVITNIFATPKGWPSSTWQTISLNVLPETPLPGGCTPYGPDPFYQGSLLTLLCINVAPGNTNVTIQSCDNSQIPMACTNKYVVIVSQ